MLVSEFVEGLIIMVYLEIFDSDARSFWVLFKVQKLRPDKKW